MKAATDANILDVVNTQTKQCSYSGVHCRTILFQNVSRKTSETYAVLMDVFRWTWIGQVHFSGHQIPWIFQVFPVRDQHAALLSMDISSLRHSLGTVVIHQLRLNRLSSTASYQALIGQIPSKTCPHSGNGDEMAEHLQLHRPKWAAERQRYFGDSIDITDHVPGLWECGGIPHLFRKSVPPTHISSAWQARHDNNNNNNKVVIFSSLHMSAPPQSDLACIVLNAMSSYYDYDYSIIVDY